MQGNRLKELRKKKQISVEELRTKLEEKFDLKISRGALSKYENNERIPKDKKMWDYLADFYGVSVPYLQGAYSEEEIEEIIITELNELYTKLKVTINKNSVLETSLGDININSISNIVIDDKNEKEIIELNLLKLINSVGINAVELSIVSLAIYEATNKRARIHGVRPSKKFRRLFKTVKEILRLSAKSNKDKSISLRKLISIYFQLLEQIKIVVEIIEDYRQHSEAKFEHLMGTIPFNWLVSKPGLNASKEEIIDLTFTYSARFVNDFRTRFVITDF